MKNVGLVFQTLKPNLHHCWLRDWGTLTSSVWAKINPTSPALSTSVPNLSSCSASWRTQVGPQHPLPAPACSMWSTQVSELLFGVHSLIRLSGIFCSEWHKCPWGLLGALQSGQDTQVLVCLNHGKPWLRVKCLPWFLPGLGLSSWDGVLGQFVTSCVSPLRPLELSESGFSTCKMGKTISTYWGPMQRHKLCFKNREAQKGRKCYIDVKWLKLNWYFPKIQGTSLYLSHLFWHQLLPGANIQKEANDGKYCSIWSPRANISSVWLDDFPHLLHSNILCQLPVFPQHFLWKVFAVGHDQTWERRSETPFYMLYVPISVLSVLTWPMTFKPIIKLYTFLFQ